MLSSRQCTDARPVLQPWTGPCNPLQELPTEHSTISKSFEPDIRKAEARGPSLDAESIYGIYIAPLQGNYSEAIPARTKRKVFSISRASASKNHVEANESQILLDRRCQILGVIWR